MMMHNRLRQLAVVLVGALLAITALHCVPSVSSGSVDSGVFGVAEATVGATGSYVGAAGGDIRQVHPSVIHPGVASVDAVMHCPAAGSATTAAAELSRLSWPAWGPAAVVALGRNLFDLAGLRAPPHPPGPGPQSLNGRAHHYRLCVIRR
ncbi:hypothetical protein [Mycobacteroides abscessus]|uniref:hypothetical protein n=2 Tax=Mycobacteroides abscessus TaxID=36809 RepID=UPI00103A5384|nr:hypothetical protein [Mycobacteroides abscessus]MBN7322847.1 hypothetical protein [Mycobacteroides abscessus subsp. massiliense]MBN7388197.1 hypothetical protein [Mycobacteroides abscessus subsp. abscessus]MBN7417658.1 hypothetical protein [Mycobacteroides abscessus subsp. abscessus]MBN7488754.1 hypothetical protein [Mycobacteroides abscessus subsp. abscessus]MBN7503103.1 hypothetical protein [Mycobacteroides abscessus subsp. abscessus]